MYMIIDHTISFVTGAFAYWFINSQIEAARQREEAAHWALQLQAAHDQIRRRRMGE